MMKIGLLILHVMSMTHAFRARPACTPASQIFCSTRRASAVKASASVPTSRDFLAVLKGWELSDAAINDECFLGPDDGCCMLGSEPLVALAERLGKPSVAPALKQLFEEVLAESTKQFDESLMGELGAPCVTQEAMRAA